MEKFFYSLIYTTYRLSTIFFELVGCMIDECGERLVNVSVGWVCECCQRNLY